MKKKSFSKKELIEKLNSGSIIATYKLELYMGSEKAFISKIKEELSDNDVKKAEYIFSYGGCEINGMKEKVSSLLEALVAVSLINDLNTSSIELEFWELQCKSSILDFLENDKNNVYILENQKIIC